jgi:EAL domain-containing protein (putative c-di-GMP-specific phosphodiesterase class I)
MELETANLARSGAVDTGWYLSGCLAAGRPIEKFPINVAAFVIGRRPGVSLMVPSARVSGRHAEILVIGENLLIRDLGSTNGTYVNRRRVARPTPIGEGDHIELADTEFRLEYRSRTPANGMQCDPALRKTQKAMDSFEPDWILSQFAQLMQEQAITPHFQPITSLSAKETLGYEALARSGVAGMKSPATMFQTAALVSRETELSILCREKSAETAAPRLQRGMPLFLNTHPREDLERDVLASVQQLRLAYPDLTLVIEIHEGAVDDPRRIHLLKERFSEHNVALAYDDFGAGQSRLLELVQAPPQYLKFDACLVRNADRASNHQWKLLKMLVEMAHDFDSVAVAEGIETGAEAEACRDLGFDYAQGFFFGRPAPLRAPPGCATEINLQPPSMDD